VAGPLFGNGAPEGRLAPGARVAGYVIEEQVGAGGMAMVFRARDEVLGRLAAIKVLAPGLAADEEFRVRFLRESRAVASVEEPHIIPVYGAGETEGLLYIATRFVPGGDLGALLRRAQGPLDPERAAALISQVASALDAAHRAGLVHRDVKPGNILVDRGELAEHAYLTDFGLIKGGGPAATGLTATGMFMGTPDYCAPEQIRGTKVDGRTDQYALACVAFALLTGRPPFPRQEVVATLFAHLNDPVPEATSDRLDLPPAVNHVLATALSKSPDDRYASCGEFAARLRDALLPVLPRPAQAGRNGRPDDHPTREMVGAFTGNAFTGTVSLRPAGAETLPLGTDSLTPVDVEPVPPGTIPPGPAGAGNPARRRTALLAGSGAAVLAAAATATVLLIPGSGHGTGALNPPASPQANVSQGTSGPAVSAPVTGTINAAGSVFQLHFQQAAIATFKSVDPGVTVNYAASGSVTGRADLAGATVLLAGSDTPIPAAEQASFAGRTLLYFPVQIGPIAIVYHLQGVRGLHLDATTLEGIFQGAITRWNDPRIAALNPDTSLPAVPVVPVVRSDGSSTTLTLSDYLAKATGSAWRLGSAYTVTWPATDRATKGSSYVAQIKSTPGAIGYVDLSTATAAHLPFASILNSAGSYVAPSSAAATAAVSHVTPAADLTFDAVDQPGATSYPITYESWDIVYKVQPTANDAALLKAYLGFLLGSRGQALLAPLHLAPLPANIQSAAVAQLSQITARQP
jgi:serine/threonine-protein kinase